MKVYHLAPNYQLAMDILNKLKLSQIEKPSPFTISLGTALNLCLRLEANPNSDDEEFIKCFWNWIEEYRKELKESSINYEDISQNFG